MSTFTIRDPYNGWSADRLKEHCRSLARAYSNYQQIILVIAEHGIDALPPEWRAEVDSLRKAYADND